MSTVNKYNYEAVLLDFAEGRLSAQETNDLFEFLAAHPELQEDFDAALEFSTLNDDQAIAFEKKDALLKSVEIDEQQNLIIAHVEGVASEEESRNLELIQKTDGTVSKEIERFAKLKFQEDETLVFSRKTELIKPVFVSFSTWIYRATFAAAAAILLFLMFNGLNIDNNPDFTANAQERLNQIKTQDSGNPNLSNDNSVFAQNDTKQNTSTEVTLHQTTTKAPDKTTVQNTSQKNTTNQYANALNTESELRFDLTSMEVLEAQSLGLNTTSELARITVQPTTSEAPIEIIKSKNSPGLFELLAEESGVIGSTFGAMNGFTKSIREVTQDFRTLNELEIKFFGKRATIRKPSWMNWRRHEVKSE
jgi:hypothetical protein